MLRQLINIFTTIPNKVKNLAVWRDHLNYRAMLSNSRRMDWLVAALLPAKKYAANATFCASSLYKNHHQKNFVSVLVDDHLVLMRQ